MDATSTRRSAEQSSGLLAEIIANMPASYFAIVLGLASLGNAWRVAERAWQPPNFVVEWIHVISGVAWTTLLVFAVVKMLLASAGLRHGGHSSNRPAATCPGGRRICA